MPIFRSVFRVSTKLQIFVLPQIFNLNSFSAYVCTLNGSSPNFISFGLQRQGRFFSRNDNPVTLLPKGQTKYWLIMIMIGLLWLLYLGCGRDDAGDSGGTAAVGKLHDVLRINRILAS